MEVISGTHGWGSPPATGPWRYGDQSSSLGVMEKDVQVGVPSTHPQSWGAFQQVEGAVWGGVQSGKATETGDQTE